MKYAAKKACILLLIAVLLLLTGCYDSSVNQYFALPKPEKEFLQLQELIDEELDDGCEYAAPTGGSNRQSVQLGDLNLDGSEEAVVFFRQSNQELKVVFYAQKDGKFFKAAEIQGEGISVAGVDYQDINSDGVMEFLICWKVANEISRLDVIDLTGWNCRNILQSDCNAFLVDDIDSDGSNELQVLRRTATGAWYADSYSFNDQLEPQASTAALSVGISKLNLVRSDILSGDTPSLLVESTLENGSIATDLLVFRDGGLLNLTASRSTGVSEVCRSFAAASSCDIDGDGYLEIPKTQQLYSQDGNIFYSVVWYRYDATGRATTVFSTYHCYEDGWYLILPAGWEAGLTVRRADTVAGESSVTLSSLDTEGNIKDLVTIFTLTGENRSEKAKQSGRFTLLETDSAIFAASLNNSGYSQKTIETNFRILYTDWNTGSV